MKEWNVFSISDEECTENNLVDKLNTLERDKWHIQSIVKSPYASLYIVAWKELIAHEDLIDINARAKIIAIGHKDLILTGDSPISVFCPVCKVGILKVWRSQKTTELLKYDQCGLCGQRVEFTDIDDMRKCDC